MDTGAFKRHVSLIAGKVVDKCKHGGKQVIKACTTGIAPLGLGPNDPGENTTAKDLSSFNYKHGKYLREADEWEENNSKLYVRFKEH